MSDEFLIGLSLFEEDAECHRLTQYRHPGLLRLDQRTFHDRLHPVGTKLLLLGTRAFQRNNFGDPQLGRFFQEPFKTTAVF